MRSCCVKDSHVNQFFKRTMPPATSYTEVDERSAGQWLIMFNLFSTGHDVHIGPPGQCLPVFYCVAVNVGNAFATPFLECTIYIYTYIYIYMYIYINIYIYIYNYK